MTPSMERRDSNPHDTKFEPPLTDGPLGEDRAEFWAAYEKEASEYDKVFLEKRKNDMDIVLIFAGLFSAVATTFIVAMQPNLSPDPTETTNALLALLIRAVDNNSTFADPTPMIPQWSGPDSTVVWTMSLAYASLSASLLAALGAVLGKQWLGHFKDFGRGTTESRCRQRQQKLDALKKWKFEVVLEALPALLQLSLLLFGIALSANVWVLNQAVASIIITMTAFGAFFYLVITAASLFSRNFPYPTPVSAIILALVTTLAQWIIRYVEHNQWALGLLPSPPKGGVVVVVLRTLLTLFVAYVIVLPITMSITMSIGTALIAVGLAFNVVLLTILFASSPIVLLTGLVIRVWKKLNPEQFQRVASWTWQKTRVAMKVAEKINRSIFRRPFSANKVEHHIMMESIARAVLRELQPESSDSDSVRWILETSIHPDIITAAAKLVPEVNWPTTLDLSVSVQHLYQTFLRSLSSTDGQFHIRQLEKTRMQIWGKAIITLLCTSPFGGYEDINHDYWKECWFRLRYIEEHSADPTLAFICYIIARLFNIRSAVRPYQFKGNETSLHLHEVPRPLLVWFLQLLPPLLQLDVTRALSFLPEARELVHELIPKEVVSSPPGDTLKCLRVLDAYMDNVLNDQAEEPVAPPQRELDPLPSCSVDDCTPDSQPQEADRTVTPLVVEPYAPAEDIPVTTNEKMPVECEDILNSVLKKLVRLNRSINSEFAEDLFLPLRSLSELLIIPTFRPSFQSHDIRSWAIRTFSQSVHAATQDADSGLSLWELARSCLQLLFHSFTSIDIPSTNTPLYANPFWTASNEVDIDCDAVVTFVVNTVHPLDDIGMACALMALPSDESQLASLVSRIEFFDCIRSAMASDKSASVRHAGLKVMHTVIKSLLLSDKEAVRESLRSHLLSILQQATFEPIQDRYACAVKTFTPDQFLFYERDLRYLQIVLELVKRDDWRMLLRQGNEGHLQRCLVLADSITVTELPNSEERSLLALYIIAVFSHMIMEERVSCPEWDGWRSAHPLRHLQLIQSAWKHSGVFKTWPDTLRVLATYTHEWVSRVDPEETLRKLDDETRNRIVDGMNLWHNDMQAFAIEQVEAQGELLVKVVADDIDLMLHRIIRPSNDGLATVEVKDI